MKHPNKLEIKAENYIVTVEPLELAHGLSELQYDILAKYFQQISTQIQIDAEIDSKAGRKKLAAELQNASKALDEAKIAIERAWIICKPHI